MNAIRHSRLLLLMRLMLPALGLLAFTSNAPAKDLVFYARLQDNRIRFGRSASPTPRADENVVSNLAAVMQAVRAARKTQAPNSRATLYLRGGTYALTTPLELTPEDSGLTIAAYRDEHPVISGGRRITGWKQVRGKPGWWQTEIPSVREGRWYFRSLFVDDRRVPCARTPDAGSFYKMQGDRVSDRPIQFHFQPSDINPAWAGDPDVEVVGFETWIAYRLHIQSVNLRSNLVTLTGNAIKVAREKGGGRYFIENTPDALDAPGEWYLDRKTGILTYLARPGEDLKSAEVIAPRLTELVRLKGDPAAGRPVQHVTLRGLTFSYSDWQMPVGGFVDLQAAFRIRGVVRAEAATDCRLVNCRFTHLGNYAVDLGQGCQRDEIVRSDLSDLGAGGVRVGEPEATRNPFLQNHNNVVTDNHIYQAGRVYASAVGVLIMQSGTNVVAHNEIDHLDYTAISVGWTWHYNKSPCCENLIEFNDLHDIGQGIMSDLAGVYTLGPQPGTVVRNNVIHNVESYSYGGWGLYADQASSDIMFENNLVYRTKTGGFHQHYGQDNIIRNNIFADNRLWQLQFTKAEDHRSFSFVNNLVYWTQGALLYGAFARGHFLMESNLYWNASRQPVNFTPLTIGLRGGEGSSKINAALAKTPVTTFQQWQAKGHDHGSIMADPEFVDPVKFDFRLMSNSPALKLGFKAIDLTGAGVRRNSRPLSTPSSDP